LIKGPTLCNFKIIKPILWKKKNKAIKTIIKYKVKYDKIIEIKNEQRSHSNPNVCCHLMENTWYNKEVKMHSTYFIHMYINKIKCTITSKSLCIPSLFGNGFAIFSSHKKIQILYTLFSFTFLNNNCLIVYSCKK
jgi:hypothetical protein